MRRSRGFRWLTWLVPLGFLLSAGCSNHSSTPAQGSQAVDTKTTVAQPAADTVMVRLAKYEGMQDAIRQFKGKVVVVDVWADW